ncbi:MAG: type II secretion system protein [Mariprofundaceae bacterium]
MPILVTGSSPTLPVTSNRGFTLLEIMLVMALMAIVAAFVGPNLFRPAGSGLNDTTRHLVRILHLASEEAQVRGFPLRWVAYADHYEFQVADNAGEWQRLNEPPFMPERLPEGVNISEIKLENSMMQGFNSSGLSFDKLSIKEISGSSEKEEESLGSVEFMSDGMLSLSDVLLHTAAGHATLELRPGPAGIRVRKEMP